jgi:TonB family protein
MNYEKERSKAKTLAFVVLSTLVHISMAAGVVHLSYQAIKDLPEVTEFEIISEDETAAQATAPQIATEAEPEMAPIIEPEEKKETETAAAVPVQKPKPAFGEKISLPKPVVKNSAPAPTLLESQSEKTDLEKSEDVAEEASRSALAAPIAALDTPTIEDDAELPLVATEPVSQFQVEKQIAEDIDQDLNKVEAAEVNTTAVDEDVEKAIQDKDDTLKAALAEAQAQDENENRQRSLAIAADKAKANELKSQEDATAAKQAEAAQALASAQAAEALAKGNQVRALEELRQKPGNKKPQYDNDDRLKGRVGEVTFHAFINKSGELGKIEMKKSTGHRTLDLKTLVAIKSWKFYPGQEGWVEIPFKWDLNGGVQEMPATLRRKVSQY